MSRELKHRVMFCLSVQQNFFDLPFSEVGPVWQGFGNVLKSIHEMEGINIVGMFDDDETMVGSSGTNFPWTAYIMADAADRADVVEVCNLFRITPVGETDYRLWKYIRVEARIGRALEVPEL
ncbi:hypothetical protein OS190_19320 [Sulfitobacter sp. F26204]|uniref:hypothetical protein n=1 Tax=Sulfitobacter sp. F26204 TaxID=2996014 RepID=UPI00225E4C52|nr:hypothetical protein [Sulfitobacter sp. F26204]MCX7561717.1 hypothetical protein [Sulfitobacter sp. F26204]